MTRWQKVIIKRHEGVDTLLGKKIRIATVLMTIVTAFLSFIEIFGKISSDRILLIVCIPIIGFTLSYIVDWFVAMIDKL